MLDAPSLKDTKIGLETLQQMGYEPNEMTLVLNRADTNVGISDEDVALILGRAPDVLVPSDVAIPRALTVGRPIVIADRKSRPARSFITLARAYWDTQNGGSSKTSGEAAPAAGTKRRLLRKAK
jgi:pilus assembly protein CpaE